MSDTPLTPATPREHPDYEHLRTIIPDLDFYRRAGVEFRFEDALMFAPWTGYGEFGQRLHESESRFVQTRLYYIHQLLTQALKCGEGEIWELGVWRGDSAMFLARVARAYGRRLRLFDTFEGMPETDPVWDIHRAGDFADTSLALVRERLGGFGPDEVSFEKGRVPETLTPYRDVPVVFAHVDLDIMIPIAASCELIFPRLPVGGAMVFDDYGWATCPGARKAVDDYFAPRPESVITLPTGQGFVVKVAG